MGNETGAKFVVDHEGRMMLYRRDGTLAFDSAAGQLVVEPSGPRVWFDGDVVPADVVVLDEDGEVSVFSEDEPSENANFGPLVEVLLPDYRAAVERARANRGE